MVATGAALPVVGAIVWLANTDFQPGTYDDGSVAGQSIGAGMASFGLLLLALAWTAAAIRRQLEINSQQPRA